MENYILKLQIESRTLGDVAQNHVLPTAIKYQNTLIENVKGLKEIFGNSDKEVMATQLKLQKEISMHVNGLKTKSDEMLEARKKANQIASKKIKEIKKIIGF